MVRAPAGNVLIPQHFGSFVYVRKTHEYLPFDGLTTEVLRAAFEGDVRRLPPALARRVPRANLRAFHRLGRRLGFLSRRGRFVGRRIDATPPPDHLLGPLTLHLGLTPDCNLRCRHCFASPEMRRGDRRLLTDAELDALFDECATLGTMRIALTGGEPLLRPDLPDLVDRIAARGIDTCLTTNGTLLDRRTAKELARRPFAWVNVSLDGATAKSNDAVRGRGTFERVVGNVRKHLRARVPFGLSVTLHRRNLDEVERLPALAKHLGARTVLLKAIYPIGEAAKNPDLAISFADYRAALARLRRTVERLQVVPTSCEEADDSLAVIFENFGCAAGNTVATVLHDGDVSPCSLIGDGVPVENLRGRTLAGIWSRGAGFTAIRRLEAPRLCRSCPDLETCSGGCRARAFAGGADLGSPDPWCRYAEG